jgi:hypothetical protein
MSPKKKIKEQATPSEICDGGEHTPKKRSQRQGARQKHCKMYHQARVLGVSGMPLHLMS